MPSKTYGIYGKSSAELVFRTGGATVRALFSGGLPDQRTNRPATKTTDSSLAQFIIEHDPKFGKVVKLISSYPTAAEREAAKAAECCTPPGKDTSATAKKGAAPAKKVAAEPAEEAVPAEAATGMVVHDECSTFNEVREVLMDLGATAKETLSKEACRATAARLNVTFPNWK